MKHLFSALLFLFVFSNAYSQKYMDKLLVESCECVDKIDIDLELQQYNLQLGLCMLEAAQPYQKQLLKDYEIDIAHIDTNGQGEKLGRMIGVKMASVCPNTLLALSNKMNPQPSPEPSIQVATATVSQIDHDPFVVFTLKDSYDKEVKYYWLSPVESDLELIQNYPALLDKKVSIRYETQELFDPKIEVYRDFNVIQEINLAIEE
ncbi:hypothetical protein BFP72_11750 [Reichenbachiella sp. 5M10]|uniref:hypothetical protein n=1 Tax=Reichenbachiella sp. 5M10 TaxID=1889772 RepID=UPI000C14DC31|nr:hypothetical protein [Reichenbachiella sp. 5M10]PIB36020.1 hypothetical protein BFP72_11750 [Reichenbachiella sp. 5M10]